MKILLVNPSVDVQRVYGDYSSAAPCLPPLGLCYLASALIRAGFKKVKIIDNSLDSLPLKKLGAKIKKDHPQIVGITSTTASFHQARKIISLCKKINPRIITVLGGAHISSLPKETLKNCPELDIGVYGEGEITFVNLVKIISMGKKIDSVRGIVFKKGKEVIINPPQELVCDLDALSLPARYLLGDLQLYQHTPFRGKNFTASIITSRGCPFGCSFCDQLVFGRKWRGHGADYVLKEIISLKKKYDINFISFEDDNFLFSKERVRKICQGLIKERIKMGWGCSARADSICKELLPLMKKAGCFSISIGIDSGTPRILKLMNKKVTLAQIGQAARLISKAGINVYGSIILGIPSETRQEMKRSINFACSLPLYAISFFLFTPYPGTVLAKMAPRFGVVSHNWRDYSTHPRNLAFIPHGFTQSEILGLQRNAYLKFYLRPKFLLAHPYLFIDRRIWQNGFRILKKFVFRT